MAGFRIEGNTSGNVAEVDVNNNIKVNLPRVLAQAGFVVDASEVDSGAVTLTQLLRGLYVTSAYRLAAGVDSLLFNEQFPGAALNTGLWSQQAATMTIALSSGLLTLNATSSIATTVNARVQSFQHFPLMGTTPLWLQALVQFPQTPVTNNVCEWGFGIATGLTAPTDGVFWRMNATGEFRGVVNFNGTETQSGTLDFAALVGTNTMRTFAIGISETEVEFWIDDVLVTTIAIPAGQSAATSSPSLPLLFRTYNSASTAAAQQMRIGQVNVTLQDVPINKSWGNTKTGMGGHASQGQTGQALVSTANYANSVNPTAAVPTNTTAALGVGLGGQFWETDTLAITTDGIISSYQNPAGTATAPGRNLYISRVTVSSFVQTALVGGGYVAQWALAYGHTLVSLATVENAAGKAPRRAPLGYQAVAAAAAAGVVLTPEMEATFDPPLVVYPGELIATVKKKIGTAPTGGVIGHLIGFDGYWE